MDYEKAYKAVLQTATQWIKDGCTDKEKICLECVFPELRDSEDERIRKKMVRFISEIKEIAESGRGSWAVRKEDTEMCDAFLEYLKRQKEPKHASDDLQKSFEEGQKSIVNNPERYGLCKKAEWSEEDKKMLTNTIFKLAGFMGNEKNIDWLKSLRPSWKPSEEQMLVLGRFLNFLHEVGSPDFGLMDSLLGELKEL